MRPEMSRRVVVVGGGIAGLAAAHRLHELSRARSCALEVVLLEASARLGGAIGTERAGEFVIEAGPDSFITEKPWALRLCERLGLTERLVSTESAYQKIYVVYQGKLISLPAGFFLLAPTRIGSFLQSPLFSWRGKLRTVAELLIPRGRSDGDESLGAFVRRRFGREMLERVAQPLVAGIYAADPERLSLSATMPRFQEMEGRRRSIILAMRSEQRRRARGREAGSGARWSLFVSLRGGMQELVDTLSRRLDAASTRLQARATVLSRGPAKTGWRIVADNQQEFDADAVVLATPAFRAGVMLEGLEPGAAGELKQIGYVSTATVSLAFRRADFPKPPDSFGFIVPAAENRKIMACTFSSLKYPGRAPQEFILLRAFVGDALQPELLDLDDATIEQNIRAELGNLLGVHAAPVLSRIYRHPKSMPQYHVGHQARIARIERALQRFPTLALAGSAYHGVGIADCVGSGEEAAEKIIGALSRSPGH
ncbi:MAG TPA: protoporphyrinogen oxidase [Candidatus Binatia bacterium]|nr:protoporphyrinogen oxidase [Candidatus Binatia bacterium]